MTGLLTIAKDQPMNRVAPVAGAGVCLSPSVSGSQISKRASPELSAKLRAARLKAERLAAEEEIALLEAAAAESSSQSVPSENFDLPHVAGSRTPVPLPRKPLSVSSPSPDEEAARCLRSQLEEVERRIAAEHAASCDPQAELKDKVNQMSLENALLRKTLAASPDHWLEHKSCQGSRAHNT